MSVSLSVPLAVKGSCKSEGRCCCFLLVLLSSVSRVFGLPVSPGVSLPPIFFYLQLVEQASALAGRIADLQAIDIALRNCKVCRRGSFPLPRFVCVYASVSLCLFFFAPPPVTYPSSSGPSSSLALIDMDTQACRQKHCQRLGPSEVSLCRSLLSSLAPSLLFFSLEKRCSSTQRSVLIHGEDVLRCTDAPGEGEG